jgi:cation transport ATPase
MLKHRIPTQVIAAIFCFCIAGIFLGINVQVLKQPTYYESADYNYNNEDLLMIAAFSLIAITSFIGGTGFLKKRKWAATLMTVLFILSLAFIIVSALSMFSTFMDDPADGMIFFFAAIGLPFIGLLFFSSVDIFPWLAKEDEEIHQDIIDHF